MTCIVGLVRDSDVWMGADRAGSDGWNIVTRTDPKLFQRGPYLIGFTDSFRMGQLLNFAGELPEPPDDPDALYGFMVRDFIDAVRKILSDGGFAKKENEVEHGGNFLVGVRGRLFEIQGDYQVGENADGIAAVGSGYQLALGALAARRLTPSHPEADIDAALRVTEQWCATVRGPFTILQLEDRRKVLRAMGQWISPTSTHFLPGDPDPANVAVGYE